LDDASTEFIPVANFPAGNGSNFDYTTAVYVDKLNRIYIFGGTIWNGTSTYQDNIWYIDLPSTLVPAFDCSNLTQGSYPHPTDCSSFFVCRDGELAGEFSCPPPLNFDPIQQTCYLPEKVVCFFTCEGREGLTQSIAENSSSVRKDKAESMCTTVQSHSSSILYSSSVTLLN
jgi:hypothetical protein